MKAWAFRIVLLAAVLLALGGLWSATAKQTPRTVTEQTRAVAQTLRCPTYAGEDVADSPSPVAEAMRQVIADQLHDGRSPDQIRAWFAERYGDGVLLDPPRRGLGWVMWAVPVALLAVAIAVLARRGSGSVRRLPLLAGAGVVAVAAVAVSWEALGADRSVPLAVDRPPVSAADVLGHAAHERPGDAQLQIALARALVADGRNAEAVEHYAAASRLRPLDADLASLYAGELIRTGDLDEARQVLTSTLGRQPQHVALAAGPRHPAAPSRRRCRRTPVGAVPRNRTAAPCRAGCPSAPGEGARMMYARLSPLVLVVLFAFLAGCTQHTPPITPTPTRVSADLRIGLTEWSIVTGPVRAASGDVRIRVSNAGATAHDLVVNGRLGTWATPVLAPGEQHELQIRTMAGERLKLICTLTGHHSQGMHTELAVEAA